MFVLSEPNKGLLAVGSALAMSIAMVTAEE